MNGGPGWICAINLPSQSRALCWLSYRATRKSLPRGLAPRTSAFAERHAGLLHFGSGEMVAAFGIAPNSPRLQRGANLSQLHSRGSSARYRAAVDRLSADCSAFELQRNKVVARRGNAPRSTGCKPAALLLSYRAKRKWLPNVDSHHDDPLNRRTCYFDIIGECYSRQELHLRGSV